MEEVRSIGTRRRRVRGLGDPHPWEPRHMKLQVVRLAEAADEAGSLTMGIIRHMWRSPVPFVGFYPPEGVWLPQGRAYLPGSSRHVDDARYLAQAEEHKREFALEISRSMLPTGSINGYYGVPTESGWDVVLDLAGQRLRVDGGEFIFNTRLTGDLAPFVWTYRKSGFCMITVYDRDLGSIRDDLLFVAKSERVRLIWERTAA